MNDTQTKTLTFQVGNYSEEIDCNELYPLFLPEQFKGMTFVATQDDDGKWSLTETKMGCTEDHTPEGWEYREKAEFCEQPHYSRRTKSKMTVRIYQREEDDQWDISIGNTHYGCYDDEAGCGMGLDGLHEAVARADRFVRDRLVGGWY